MFISSGFSGLACWLLKPLVLCTIGKRETKYDVLTLCNGILIGLVSISGVVDDVQNWGAVLIGSISAVWYVGAVLFLEFYRIDDPLEVFPVHCVGGIWGLFATGFFDQKSGALFYGAYRQGEFMAYQIVGITVIICWVSLIAMPAFLILRKIHLLRADKAIEEIGFDVAELQGVSEEFIEAVRDRLDEQDRVALEAKKAAEKIPKEHQVDDEKKALKDAADDLPSDQKA